MFDDAAGQVSRWVTHLAALPRDLGDAERVDLIRALEELKCAAAAAQATAAVDLDASQRAAQAASGRSGVKVGEGIASQLALARRESPHRASRLLGLAKVLHTEMPHTLDQMRAGRLSEWRATIVARETACLSLAERREVDARLCGPEGPGPDLSETALTRAAAKLAADLDPHAVTARARKAETERHTTLRPAPDTMTWFGALLPVKDGVAVHAALIRAAATARTQGDPRSRGQVMADTLVQRVTGAPTDQPARVNLDLVMTDRSLFHTPADTEAGPGQEAAHLPGYGPVPAPWARDLLAQAMSAGQVWVRRLYTHPTTGQLTAMDSRARHAPPALADLIGRRDQDLCRTPWCGAALRTTDHAHEWHAGGRTTETNLQGLCERCNLAKQAPGWHARATPSTTRHTISTTTPTGHTYQSRAPAPPGHHDPQHVAKPDAYELIV